MDGWGGNGNESPLELPRQAERADIPTAPWEPEPEPRVEKSDIFSSNRYLSEAQMKVNAAYIFDFFDELGWEKNAICALLGNMQAESTINPGLWQDFREGNKKVGFGLTQWSPPHDLPYFDWAEDNGLDPYDIDTQLHRIALEAEGKIYQWQKYRHKAGISFADFTTSTLSLSELTEIFLFCYERPKTITQAEIDTRVGFAEDWNDFFR